MFFPDISHLFPLEDPGSADSPSVPWHWALRAASPGCPQRGHGHVLEVLTRVQTSLDHIENAGRHGRETKHVLNRQEVNENVNVAGRHP